MKNCSSLNNSYEIMPIALHFEWLMWPPALINIILGGNIKLL